MVRKEEKEDMRYKVRVAGKIFEGSDTRALIRLAVAARREARKQTAGSLHTVGKAGQSRSWDIPESLRL